MNCLAPTSTKAPKCNRVEQTPFGWCCHHEFENHVVYYYTYGAPPKEIGITVVWTLMKYDGEDVIASVALRAEKLLSFDRIETMLLLK